MIEFSVVLFMGVKFLFIIDIPFYKTYFLSEISSYKNQAIKPPFFDLIF